MMETVIDFYGLLLSEHKDTERLLQQLDAKLASQADLAQVKALFDEIILELDRHFACEEHALFPVLSQYRTMILLEVEHDNLLDLRESALRELEKSLEQQQATPALHPSMKQFAEVLRAHMVEEESGIFPQADALLEPEEKAMVKRKLEEMARWVRQPEVGEVLLERPNPTFNITKTNVLKPSDKPIVYKKLFGEEHASVHHLYLQPGEELSYHWASEHQCMIVLAGEVVFKTPHEEFPLEPGTQINIDPRYRFALRALSYAHLMVFKVWPRPHFVRV
jgi:hemerythrin-like domain-containing protein/mannose-6-phosphate isomerase-like protein (cupin superfamily)